MIGIIGGTGLERPDFLQFTSELEINTAFGSPSSPVKLAEFGGKKIAFISRHGENHNITPTHVNNAANILALQQTGCNCIIATTACGSLREEIGRGDLVIVDQFIDFTRHRRVSFYDSFDNGEMKHTAMAEPFDYNLRKMLAEAARQSGINVHTSGTVITIEGPRFSTRAESNMFRIWGADIINMSTAPEAILANEAAIPYAVVALSTDYDCWKTNEEPVSIEEVIHTFRTNIPRLIQLLSTFISGYIER
ncbi:MAG: MTAP family purine nucleoside phosphorylase [Bacteroidales bacterium]|nr:MTAP family purine nucleoside phosphorylase [Bacteroidales bacterium]HOY38007.1 MTAP family purine nucleoside phosphorylase [Bacteroidales bacterium]HQP04311.1 MTAP family purine nucleoside phosphorylase [Bacteroidales bacterium]